MVQCHFLGTPAPNWFFRDVEFTLGSHATIRFSKLDRSPFRLQCRLALWTAFYVCRHINTPPQNYSLTTYSQRREQQSTERWAGESCVSLWSHDWHYSDSCQDLMLFPAKDSFIRWAQVFNADLQGNSWPIFWFVWHVTMQYLIVTIGLRRLPHNLNHLLSNMSVGNRQMRLLQ